MCVSASINSVEASDVVSSQAEVPEFVPTIVVAECDTDEVVCSASQAMYADMIGEEDSDSSYSQLVWVPFTSISADDHTDSISIGAKIVEDWWILHFVRDELVCGQQDSQEYDTMVFGRDPPVSGTTPAQPVKPMHFIR